MQEIQFTEGCRDIASATWYLHCCFTGPLLSLFNNIFICYMKARLKNRDSVL